LVKLNRFKAEAILLVIMTDYSQGKVYKLHIAGIDELCYIGSTVMTLEQRLAKHKYQKTSGAQYQFASAPLFEEGNDVCISLIEAFPCANKQELLTREAYWLLQHPDAINKNTPILTAEEKVVREKSKALKSYYKHHEERKEKHRQWLADNDERVKAYADANRENKNAKQRAKVRTQEQKDIANERKREKVECPICKMSMNKAGLKRHNDRTHSVPSEN
jgi:hypothetical protein